MAFQRTLIGAAVLCTAFPVLAANHVLDGRTLTVDELWTIAQPGETVSLSDEGWKRIDASYIVPIKAAEAGEDIYGLTVNYGALKDKKVTGELGGSRTQPLGLHRVQRTPDAHSGCGL